MDPGCDRLSKSARSLFSATVSAKKVPRKLNVADEFIQAMRLHQKGEVAEAEAMYVRLLREQPDHAGAWQLLGVALHQRGEHEAALDLIGQAISLEGRQPRPSKSYDKPSSTIRNERSYTTT